MESGKTIKAVCPICGNYTFVHINKDGTFSSKCLICKTKLRYIQKRSGIIELLISNKEIELKQENNISYNLFIKRLNSTASE